MSNRVNLTLDVTKKGVQNPLIKIRQGDGDFETLRTTVLSNGEPLDLQGWTITFMATTAGNHKIIDSNAIVVEAQNGIFDYTPSKAWGMDVGDFKIAYFKFIKDDGSASSANLRVEVIQAIDLTQEEAQNYISVIDATIAETREHLENSLADVSSSVAATSVVASSMAVNVSNVASSAADRVNVVTSSAIENVNIVATNAVDKIDSAASGASMTTSRAIDEVNSVASNAVNDVSNVASSAVAKVNGVAARVNELSIGGRNLLLNSRLLTIKTFPNAGVTVEIVPYDSKTNMWHITAPQGGSINAGLYFPQSVNVTNPIAYGVKWVFSLDIKGTGIHSQIGVEGSNPFNKVTGPVTTGWTRIVSTGVSQGSDIVVVYFDTSKSPLDIYIKLPKLEVGNVPTDWTPAPEDAPSNDAQLVHKTGTETIAGDKTFTGNTTVSTTTILAGNYGLRVTASGIQKTTDGKTWTSANI